MRGSCRADEKILKDLNSKVSIMLRDAFFRKGCSIKIPSIKTTDAGKGNRKAEALVSHCEEKQNLI